MRVKDLLFGIGILIAGLGVGICNPLGPIVVNGNITTQHSSNSLTINQHTQHAIIDWDSFSIGAGEVTTFVQPSSSAAVLNRVVTSNPSSILGQLNANGRVLLINPNGILVGPSGTIDAGGGFLASTLDVPNSEFLAGGNMTFSGNSPHTVTNLGSISANSGDIFLLGSSVINLGNLTAPQGTVGLAAGERILVSATGDERIFVEVGSSGTVDHAGQINSVAAELRAKGTDPNTLAVNVAGLVQASAVHTSGNRIFLTSGAGLMKISAPARTGTPSGSTASRIEIDAGEIDISNGEVVALGSGQTDIVITADRNIIGTDFFVIGAPGGNGNITLTAGGSINFYTTSQVPLLDHLNSGRRPGGDISVFSGRIPNSWLVTSNEINHQAIVSFGHLIGPSSTTVLPSYNPIFLPGAETQVIQNSTNLTGIIPKSPKQGKVEIKTEAVNVRPPSPTAKTTARDLKKLFDPTGSRNFIETKISR